MIEPPTPPPELSSAPEVLPFDRNRSATRPPAGRRLWLFRGLAVLLALVPFLVLEGGLRWLGIGRDPALVIPSPQEPGTFQFNSDFDRAYYGETDLSGPELRPFRLPKPAGVRRILVVGGSTVAGFPFPSELAFPRYIEAYLQAQADSGETIEVLNAGITAIGSSTEVDVVREGLAVDPDIVVVYTGHNEFYGPGGVASSSGSLSPGWFRALARVRGLRTVQFLRQVFRRRPADTPSRDLLEVLPGDVHIPLASPTFAVACHRYRDNLRQMAALAAERRVPMLFATPVANERDQPPIERLDPSQIAPLVIDGQRYEFKSFDGKPASGDTHDAVRILKAFHQANPAHPLVAYRYAQALERTDDFAMARDLYQEALEIDGCRFRAPRAFREIVLTEVASGDGDGVATLDLYPMLGELEVCGAPGRRSLVEHVHLTWEGNEAVGKRIARGVWQQMGRTWEESREPTRGELFERLGTLPEDLLAALVLSSAVYQRTPFREGADAERLGKRLAEEAAAVYSALPDRRKALIDQVPTSAMSTDLLSTLLSRASAPDDTELRTTFLRAGLRRRPWNHSWRDELDRLPGAPGM
ncbi:hypothetical protein [Planctomyces sp. SH-PL14]|uniref:hypothetical protein n=1 Tax=Planctomyces sp. SH-PL14 TaxID=1632864 RepID=UPI00078CC05E|nr:hypothetical protein [Planctomyces sp. SH-PL14]AMV17307.1 hypothetical protein VT03_05405 [Planctomyces sp. SH-PL14]